MVAALLLHEAPRAVFAVLGLGPIACVRILAPSLVGWGTLGLGLHFLGRRMGLCPCLRRGLLRALPQGTGTSRGRSAQSCALTAVRIPVSLLWSFLWLSNRVLAFPSVGNCWQLLDQHVHLVNGNWLPGR